MAFRAEQEGSCPLPSLLLTRRWPHAVEDELHRRYRVTVDAHDQKLSKAELQSAMRNFDVLCPTVSDRLDADVLGTPGARVRLIANYGAGVDHIDLAAARRAGVAVSNTPDVLTDATADLALLLMLMASRRASEGERELRGGWWSGWRPTHMLGRSLSGRLLGVVGFGRIGQATGAACRGRSAWRSAMSAAGRCCKGSGLHDTVRNLWLSEAELSNANLGWSKKGKQDKKHAAKNIHCLATIFA